MKTAAGEIYCCENIEAFRLGGYSIWIGEVAGSNPVFYTNVVSSLSGKVSHCECEEQGSIPGDNQCGLV